MILNTLRLRFTPAVHRVLLADRPAIAVGSLGLIKFPTRDISQDLHQKSDSEASVTSTNTISLNFRTKIGTINLRHVYLGLTACGAIIPPTIMIPFWQQIGDRSLISAFMGELFATNVSSACMADLGISIASSIIYYVAEGRSLGMSIPVIFLSAFSSTTIGLCFGLPLFLYLRQRHIEKLFFSKSN